MRFLVINGPNLNLLGVREPDIYGRRSYDDLVAQLQEDARELGVEIRVVQSNHEGAIVDAIQSVLHDPVDGIVINPAAYTHTSVAILDALKAVAVPAVEVHLSQVDAREKFRQVSYAGMACIATVQGKGFAGYREAMEILLTNRERKPTR